MALPLTASHHCPRPSQGGGLGRKLLYPHSFSLPLRPHVGLRLLAGVLHFMDGEKEGSGELRDPLKVKWMHQVASRLPVWATGE